MDVDPLEEIALSLARQEEMMEHYLETGEAKLVTRHGHETGVRRVGGGASLLPGDGSGVALD